MAKQAAQKSPQPQRSRSSHRLGFDVQQVLQLTGRSVSGIQAVRDDRDALVQKQSQALGGQLGQGQVESRRRQALNLRPERSSPLRSQGRQQTSQPSCARTWHRGKGYGSSCRKQGNAEPDCGKRTAEALSQKAAARKHKQVSWSSRGRGQRSARSTPDLRQGQVRAEHQQGGARPDASLTRADIRQGSFPRHRQDLRPTLWKPSR